MSIALLGDEFLDNKHFLDVPDEDLTYDLTCLGYKIVNVASKKNTLKKLVGQEIPKAKYYVLSIGTEDFKGNITAILNPEKFVDGILSSSFKKTFEAYVEKLCKKGKVVFVIAPKPYMGQGSTYKKYKTTIEYIIGKWLEYVETVGRKYEISLIDSTSLFSPESVGLYNSDQLHGSHITSKVVALLIKEAIQSKGYTRYTSINKKLIDDYVFHGINVDKS